MKTEFKYIHFQHAMTKTKTFRWDCYNTKHQAWLGSVSWYCAWRQYCFFPTIESGVVVFNADCLAAIRDFLREANAIHKSKGKS